MVITLQQIVILWCVYLCLLDSPAAARKRVKRILNGLPLPSHDLYNTHFLVEMLFSHGCVSEQFDHKLEDCKLMHRCSGGLIREDFVLTACHCMSYEVYYAEYPPVREIEPGDIPPYIDDRINLRSRTAYDPIVYPKTATVIHPLLNSMVLFAGHPVREMATQRRHAAKFFPHHLCFTREKRAYPKKWKHAFEEVDVGLVKPCYPFLSNQDVKLAPIKPYDEIEKHLDKMVHQSFMCLVAGWGKSFKPRVAWTWMDRQVGYGIWSPDTLQHSFRYMDCYKICAFDYHHCSFCTTHQGPVLTATAAGDSGTPIICDGYYTGVHVRSADEIREGHFAINFTVASHFAVACVKDFITVGHLAYLRSTQTEAFHWLNGHPVTLVP